MNGWSKEDLEEMCGDDIIDQLAFLSGCFKHKLSNDKVIPDGWIIPDELLRKFAELIVKKCAMIGNYAYDGGEYPGQMIKEYFGVEE